MAEVFAPYKSILDPADTLFAANFLLQYFSSAKDAPELMRLQKVADLKSKDLWDSKDSFSNYFRPDEVIDPSNPNFGINVYPAGAAVDKRSTQPPHNRLLDLTSTHINHGGHGKYDFVVTMTRKHESAKLIKDEIPKDEFVLGFIRLDSGVLNNAPLRRYLDIQNLDGDFVNTHLAYGAVIVPTSPFSKLRGGKMIALIATSNEIRDFYNNNFKDPRRIAIFYTTSLYGSSKSNCQYDQLDRYLKFIGNTTGKFPLRIRDPHRTQLIDWLVDRGINRNEFTFRKTGSKADKSHKALIHFVAYCLRKHSQDKNISEVRKKYDTEMELWENGKTEVKRTYISTYGFEHWQDNIINQENESNEEYSLDSLFTYWKTKVFKKKDWGMRKEACLKDEFHLSYDLLSENLKDPMFNQVR